MKVDYLVVGSGLTGATIARLLSDAGREVAVVDRRRHAGGNVHDHTHASGIRHAASILSVVLQFRLNLPPKIAPVLQTEGDRPRWSLMIRTCRFSRQQPGRFAPRISVTPAVLTLAEARVE